MLNIKNLHNYFPLLLLLPALPIAGRLIYFFEIFVFAYLLIYFLNANINKISQRHLLVCFGLFGLLLLINFYQVIYFNTSLNTSFIRVGLLLLCALIFSNSNAAISEKSLLFVIAFASILAIAQSIEGRFFGPGPINTFISFFYPYNGDVGFSVITKTQGLNLATNGVFNATSIVDGHTILAGNFLAICAIYTLFRKKYALTAITALAVIMTFSRGSWIIMLTGFSIWSILNFKKFFSPKLMFSLFLIILIFLFIPENNLFNAINLRVVDTLIIFGLIEGISEGGIDPRRDIVWPRFFEHVNSTGISGWLFGSGFEGPVDSGYFLILKEFGLIGLILVIFFGFYFVWSVKKSTIFFVIFLSISIAMVVNPVQQGMKLIFLIYCIYIIETLRFKNA